MKSWFTVVAAAIIFLIGLSYGASKRDEPVIKNREVLIDSLNIGDSIIIKVYKHGTGN